jgi:hypothetical protein
MTPRTIANVCVIAIFLATVGGYGGLSLGNAVRDRTWPALARFVPWRQLPGRAEEQFTEHLLGRTVIARWNGRAKTDWFKVSPSPRVLRGRDGWLFYNSAAEPGAVAPDDRSFPERLDRWATALSARRAWLTERDIHFLVVLAPDKQSIYPEYVPAFARHGAGGLDQLLVRLGADCELNVLDLRPTLRAAAPAGSVYWRTDTHWNPAGAYLGYVATVNALARSFPVMNPLLHSAFASRPIHSGGGDLARLIGLNGQMPENASRYDVLTPARARLVDEGAELRSDQRLSHVRPQVWVNDSSDGPKVLLLGDSFADDTYCSLLAEHCSRLVKVGSYAGQEELIERERPDVVVFEFAERVLQTYVPRPPAAVTSASRPSSRREISRRPR